MTIKLTEAIESLRPGAEFSVSDVFNNPGYANIEWLDQSQTKPTEQEVLDEITRLEALEASEAQRQAGVKASAYVTQWDDALKRKTVTQIKALFDGATAQQKSDLLFYLLLVRALEVKD